MSDHDRPLQELESVLTLCKFEDFEKQLCNIGKESANSDLYRKRIRSSSFGDWDLI